MKVNPQMTCIKEIDAVLKAGEIELNELREFTNLLSSEALVSSASLLSRWEQSMAIPPVEDKELRRAHIIQKLQNVQPLTRSWLTRKLVGYVRYGSFIGTVLNINTLTLTITFDSETTAPQYLIYQELRRLIPANLLLEVQFTQNSNTTVYTEAFVREHREETIQ